MNSSPILSMALFRCALSINLLLISNAFANQARSTEPISPLPSLESLDLEQEKINLGEKLFQDTRFSRDNSTSCATCHNLQQGGSDNLKLSIGVHQQTGSINSPTVFNSGLNFQQFWDGRAPTLEQQLEDVVHNPKELDMSWTDLLERLNKDRELVAEFKAIYPDAIQPQNIQDAIVTFEKSLLTPSRFDRYLEGDDTAIEEEELAGYQLFKNYGCIACHQGANVGGNMFQKFGAINDYYAEREITKADLGRFNVTGLEEDKHVFKVPSLRNVKLTAPYFHDGSVTELEEAVDIMFRHQLGRSAPEKDKQLIVKFLGSLTGEALEKKP